MTFFQICNMVLGFRSSADLLAVVSNRIVRVFDRSGATKAVAIDISKVFERVWHAGLFQKLTSYGTSGQIFGLFSVIHGFEWYWMEVFTRISN